MFPPMQGNGGASSGIYGQPKPATDDDVLGLVNQLKDREMRDFQNKAEFMSALSLKQDRLRKVFDLQDQQAQEKAQQPQQTPMVMGRDPNQLTGYERGELGIRQQGIDLNKQELAQKGKLGQEALDIKGQQEKLNQTKSEQIHEQKQADLERKIAEADKKLELANRALDSKNTNTEAQLQAHKDIASAVEERHKLEMARLQHQFDVTSGQHQETIKALQKKLDQNSEFETTTELSPDGTKKIVNTKRGSSAQTIKGTGRDGKTYDVPLDKLDDWNANHAAPGTEIKKPGGEED